MQDLHVAASAFVGVMVAEAIVKPIAVRVARYLIRKADLYVNVIPDWLHDDSQP